MTAGHPWIWTAPLVLLLGLASGCLSGSGDGNPRFAAVAEPRFMPPAWAFPVARTLLYLASGTALGLGLERRRGRPGVALFAGQLALDFEIVRLNGP